MTALPLMADDAADRYLELLRRCLTRHELGDDLAPVVPHSPRRRRAWKLASTLLATRRLVVLRRPASDSDVRSTGRDWPVHAETMVGIERLLNLQSCIDLVLAEKVEGDLLEAGVWRGGASIFMRGVLAARGVSDRTVWVADSFQGLPRPRNEHLADAEDVHWTQPYLAVSQAEVQANFGKYRLLDDQVRFLPGWFADVLPSAPVDRLAVLRVDGDMYGSTMDVLTALYDRVEVGGFVIIDDYGAIPACKAAVDDFRGERGIDEPLTEIDWTGVFWRRER